MTTVLRKSQAGRPHNRDLISVMLVLVSSRDKFSKWFALRHTERLIQCAVRAWDRSNQRAAPLLFELNDVRLVVDPHGVEFTQEVLPE